MEDCANSCRTAANSCEQLPDRPNLVIGTSPERGGERKQRDIPCLASHAGSRCAAVPARKAAVVWRSFNPGRAKVHAHLYLIWLANYGWRICWQQQSLRLPMAPRGRHTVPGVPPIPTARCSSSPASPRRRRGSAVLPLLLNFAGELRWRRSGVGPSGQCSAWTFRRQYRPDVADARR